jgi:hypothetical protein
VWVAAKNSRSGKAYVYVDGVKVASPSLYSPSSLSGQQVFKKVFAASGTHTIRIVVAESGRRASLDAFIVLK